MKTKKISIVTPVLNEIDSLPRYIEALNNFINSYGQGYIFEVIILDNNSTDNSYSYLKDKAQLDCEKSLIKFSKNIGYQLSILHGLKKASGDCAIVVDSDLQDPLETAKEFIKKWEKGGLIVGGLRNKRDENYIVSVTRNIFYKLIRFFSTSSIPVNIGDFYLLDKKILNLLKEIKSRNVYLRGFIFGLGVPYESVVYKREKRKYGKTKFSIIKLIKFSKDALFLTSNFPQRFTSFVSYISFFTSFILSIYFVIIFLSEPATPPGFTALATLLTFSIFINSVLHLINGTYVKYIYENLHFEPLAVAIDNTIEKDDFKIII
jgi:polyisoprenyl-phosphate glycosyltransferase